MFFERLLILLFKVFLYINYRKKYNLNPTFKFNGYLIRFNGEGEIIVGDGSYISFYSYINVLKGTMVRIGKDVSIGHNVKIYTSGIDTKELILNQKKKIISGNVIIGNNVLIGANCFICPGVTIGHNVVVGANSVVTVDIIDNSVVVGSPAKVVKIY